MRRIKITQDLRDSVENFNNNLFVDTRHPGFTHPKDRLNKLLLKVKPIKHKEYRRYIQKILDEYYDILNADPNQMYRLIGEFDSIVHHSQLSRKITSKKFSFHEKIIEALRYEDLRDKEYPEYLLNSNFRTCVYCNAQSALQLSRYIIISSREKRGKRF